MDRETLIPGERSQSHLSLITCPHIDAFSFILYFILFYIEINNFSERRDYKPKVDFRICLVCLMASDIAFFPPSNYSTAEHRSK